MGSEEENEAKRNSEKLVENYKKITTRRLTLGHVSPDHQWGKQTGITTSELRSSLWNHQVYRG